MMQDTVIGGRQGLVDQAEQGQNLCWGGLNLGTT
jgi:hypothetical protein